MPGPENFTPDQDLALILTEVAAAGKLALRYWRQEPKQWDKGGDHGPVSEADLAVNDRLKAAFTAARPGYGWLSEETPDGEARLGHERLFIIDPIDGTRAFLAGEDGFAISVAVAVAGVVAAGVVHLPAKGLTYAAAAGGVATRNGMAISASATKDLGLADVLTTRASLAPEHWPQGVPAFHRSFRSSLAWRLCLVAEGRHDAVLTLRKCWEWDIAAGALIAERAGCLVTDRTGAGIGFNRAPPQAEGLVAGGAVVQRALVAALAQR